MDKKTLYREALQEYLRRTGKESFRVKAALIDMDGVLYDTMPLHSKAWYKLFSSLGVKCTPEEFYLYEGMTGHATINMVFQREFSKTLSEEECAELYQKKVDYFHEQGEGTLMSGADRMLRTLVDRGLKRVLVTGSGQKSILDKVDEDYPGVFTQCEKVTSNNVTKGKPAPEPYLLGMKFADVKPEESIVIENAPLGVRAGVAAGAFTIAVTTGPIPREEMLRCGANIVFDDMEQFASELGALLDVLGTK